ncbi:transposase [Thermodesulfovibrio thiophilus]|uniref:transposase n=1 Tax=Thermodesulfovibrio thiophilus TaxID=340095 RepID=UPI0012EB75DE
MVSSLILIFFFCFSKNMWKKLRTTNVIERSFRELRRRTKTMSCFNNVKSI